MKSLCLFVFVCAAWAQTPPVPSNSAPPASAMPNLSDDTVIATFDDGVKFTMKDFKAYYNVLPPQNQQMALRDKAAFLHQWAVLRKLTRMADEKKLGELSPYKEAIDHARMQVMVQAVINELLNQLVVESADIARYYEENKSKFEQVKVKAIYVTYNDNPSSTSGSKKVLTEAEAKAKAEKLVQQIRGGADFVKLVKENSEDDSSREKDGDFATLHFNDNIPDAFRAAIFKLKQGEVTEPLKQPNGYYILRAEEVSFRTLSEVRDTIYNDLKNKKYNEWMVKTDQETKIQINPEFAPPAAK